ncbi:P-loop containing nucleoside triphosphate hydrolase protein [Aspergillus pseudocaelatus]|uniref:P-loop containing nucleoside triphosphate hydrolase protein n=1 Tax=Aspergillus pseudocaelatus TaxID=1825620 RepID=A0ABQ6WDI7_9EURO|nr:P-loop containing nucleoside triphosphate hydrolase protein [Aspergillus pseudocaelatus]
MKKETSESSILADPALLDKIDKLFACNVGEHIALPQLVVVGDQSSGKSSVLEGLTQLPFPRDSGLCTRFATQIIFRRDRGLSTRKVSASIIPASDSDVDRAARLRTWHTESIDTLEPSRFSKVMQEVHELMGVAENSVLSTFSKDVLRLEICGPEEDHLSVIDVPGIFKNTTPGLTSKSDIAVVREMVEGYMKNPRSIMLTVVPANVDIATQEIIEMAREYDAEGERTIGVLTKPDLVDKGAEDKVLDLVVGNKLFLRHGWTIVRNLNQQELTDGNTDRDEAEEAFSQKAPWNTIAKDKFGIKSLKSRLQETVTENARREFPSVRSEITKRLKEAKNSLKALGNERETPEQKVGFLLDIMNKFQEITSQALSTSYGENDIFDEHVDLRLATRVVTRDTAFAEDLERYGHEYNFDTSVKKTPDSSDANSTTAPSDESEDVKEFHARKTGSMPELEDVVTEQTWESVPSDNDIYEWLKQLYQSSRGFEIGTFNTSLLATSMKKQSAKWSNFAKGYISDVITIVHGFIVKTLEIVCVDRRVFNNLLSIMMDNLLDKYQCALTQVDFLLHVERNQAPKTLNHYFNENLQRCRQERQRCKLESKVINDNYGGEVVRLEDLTVLNHMSNSEYTVQDIHDILESYYKVARKRFVDNICMQAADYYLVTGPETPTKLFSSSLVNKLSNDELGDIAGEDASTVRRRINLKKTISELEEGRRILF